MLLPNLSDEATQFLNALYLTNSVARRYQSPENNEAILQRVKSFRATPCETAVLRALNKLVEEGMERGDGGNAETDAAAQQAKEKARLARIAQPPLSTPEIEYFQRLSPAELYQLYFADLEFKTRYDVACNQLGFNRPVHSTHAAPSVARKITALPPATEPISPVHLTAIEYKSMPSRVVQARYTREPAFKAEVDRLIAQGQI